MVSCGCNTAMRPSFYKNKRLYVTFFVRKFFYKKNDYYLCGMLRPVVLRLFDIK